MHKKRYKTILIASKLSKYDKHLNNVKYSASVMHAKINRLGSVLQYMY